MHGEGKPRNSVVHEKAVDSEKPGEVSCYVVSVRIKVPKSPGKVADPLCLSETSPSPSSVYI